MSNDIVSEDRVLIDRYVNQNDQDAFNILAQKYSGRAYQIAYGVLGNREDAEEVAQDAFVRIYRALPKFRGDSELSTWMYRIIINLARNKHRWNRVRGAGKNFSIDAPIDNGRGDGELTIDLPDQGMAPDQISLYNELKEKTKQAMAKLPESYREAVILRTVKGLSYEEIAEVLGCKVGTVKSRIARGREEIRNNLDI